MDWKEALRVRADGLRADYDRLVQQKRAVDVALERVRLEVDHLNPVLSDAGLVEVVTSDASKGTLGGFASPGNKSENMPARRAMFANVSLVSAIEGLLDGGVPKHADNLVRDIWDVRSQSEHNHGKRSLVSTLVDGVKKNKWARVGANTFQRAADDPRPGPDDLAYMPALPFPDGEDLGLANPSAAEDSAD